MAKLETLIVPATVITKTSSEFEILYPTSGQNRLPLLAELEGRSGETVYLKGVHLTLRENRVLVSVNFSSRNDRDNNLRLGPAIEDALRLRLTQGTIDTFSHNDSGDISDPYVWTETEAAFIAAANNLADAETTLEIWDTDPVLTPAVDAWGVWQGRKLTGAAFRGRKLSGGAYGGRKFTIGS